MNKDRKNTDTRVQCKGGCDYMPDRHDTLEGYCMTCAAKKIKEIARLQADLAQGHACNACLKDQLEHGKRQCCVGQDSCDVDGEILRLRAELADKLGELDAECRVSQLAIKEVGNLQAKVTRLEKENILLAKLASRNPEFYNPVVLINACDVRDRILQALKETHQ